MKIAVSYLSSNDYKDSVKKIENSKADFVHCDICDGSYVKTNNFNKENFLNLFNRVNKKLNVHLMVEYPKRYVDMLKGLNVDEIIIHNVKDIKDILEYIKSLNISLDIFADNVELMYDKQMKEKIEKLTSIGKMPQDIYLNPSVLTKYDLNGLNNAIDVLLDRYERDFTPFRI